MCVRVFRYKFIYTGVCILLTVISSSCPARQDFNLISNFHHKSRKEAAEKVNICQEGVLIGC